MASSSTSNSRERVGVDSMSYCRFSEGDVYMYPSEQGIACCLCLLAPQWLNLPSRQEALSHLLEHRQAAHTVPQHAIDRLQDEIGLSA